MIEALTEKPQGETAVEAYSRTVSPNPFIRDIQTRIWDFKVGEAWRFVLDERSQVDLVVKAGHGIRGLNMPESDKPKTITIEGFRMEAYRPPDAQSFLHHELDIDNWR